MRNRPQVHDDDPDVQELKEVDAEYHRLCIDIQEPTLALEELRLDELAAVAIRLSQVVDRLRTRRRSDESA